MKKKWIYAILVLIILFLSPRLGLSAYSAIRYLSTQNVCVGEGPVPILIDNINLMSVSTDRGIMYPGDVYDVPGEGTWLGNATLIYAGTKGAAFLFKYPSEDGKKRLVCRWYVSKNYIYRK